MRAEGTVPAAPTAPLLPDEGGTAPALSALTRRASLNAVAALLDYAVKAAVVLLVTPVLVGGLGRTLYGVWEMLTRLGTSMSAVDGRPTDALRLVVAQQQGSDDAALKRRYVGASLAIWAVLLPVLALIGGALAWWAAPLLTRATPELRGAVRLTSAVIVVAFLVTSIASVPEAVLRGSNQGYRRLGVQSSLNVFWGLLAAGAIWGGFGLVGVGVSQLLLAVATGICFWLLARSFVEWFGVARPRRSEVKGLFGMGLWLAAGDALSKILQASDVLILGAVIAPATVTTYVLTGYAARTAQGMHIFAAGAAIPGLGGLLGTGERARAAQARRELLLLTWWFATVVGATILAWNRSFISLWVGEANYAGALVDLLVVAITAQTVFIRVDSYVIDAALQPKQRVLVALGATALSIALGIVLTHQFGIAGLCVGFLLGRAPQSLAYPALARRRLGVEAASRAPASSARRWLVTAALFATAAALGQRIAAPGWMWWGAGVAATVVVAAAVSLWLGPNDHERRKLRRRLGAIRAGGGR